MTELKYLSNVVKKDIGMISLSEAETYEAALHQILEYYKNAGVNVDEKGEHLYIFANDKLIPFLESNWLLSTDNKIIYSDVVVPNSAYSFYENDGIRYFFHTDESNHRDYPHVHAENGGDEISINLRNFQIKGKFSNNKKQKIAVRFVRDNQKKFKQAWDVLIKEGRCLEWHD
ncbi:MAG: DUF4160 domain-containing protein [Clostridiales bacterium]|nr:DUF4160 domain-containing protein [Clostridiales bacterium]